MERLFSYGTLLQPKVQIQVFHRTLVGTPARLIGYEEISVWIDGVSYPSLRKSANGIIEGMIFEVTANEIVHADEYEGKRYKRARLILQNGEVAWVYLT